MIIVFEQVITTWYCHERMYSQHGNLWFPLAFIREQLILKYIYSCTYTGIFRLYCRFLTLTIQIEEHPVYYIKVNKHAFDYTGNIITIAIDNTGSLNISKRPAIQLTCSWIWYSLLLFNMLYVSILFHVK